MLIWFVALYLLATVAIGFYASTRVHNTRDFASGGRSMGFPIVAAMVFATWFGSEAVLGIPATFLEEGFAGIVEDPFGSFWCLFIVGAIIARPLYRLNLLTIGDYFKKRYGSQVELIVSLVIVMSYLGWIAAQLIALGVVFNVLSDGAISTTQGMLLGTFIVLLYTLFGGMWSIALTDFFQMIIIVVGLIYLVWLFSDMAGGADLVISKAASEGKFTFMHSFEPKDIVAFIGAAVTMMLGSIPQQDVYQRVMSAKTENIAARASMAGAVFYLAFCMLPIFLVYAASMIDPALVQKWLAEDAQMILPLLILEKTPLFAQIMFFGALLSAIMSTASGTLLAPSVTLTENVLKRFLPAMKDHQFLRAMRLSIVAFAFGITGGVHSGRSVQSFHFQSGVIGKAVQLIVPVDKRRFQQGISFQRFGCFGNVRVAVNVIQTEQFYLIPEDGSYFFEFMSIVGGKYKFAFHCLILVF